MERSLFNLINATLLSLRNVTYKTYVYKKLDNKHLQGARKMWPLKFNIQRDRFYYKEH